MSEHEILNGQANGQSDHFAGGEYPSSPHLNSEKDVWGDSFSETDFVPIKTQSKPFVPNVASPGDESFDQDVEAALDDLFNGRDHSDQGTSIDLTTERWVNRLMLPLGQVDSDDCFEGLAAAIATMDQPSFYSNKFQSFLDRNAMDLDESQALGAAIALFYRHPEQSAIPILAGLTARVVVAPRLEHTQQAIKPSVMAPIFASTQRGVERLVEQKQLTALPKLSARLGHIILRRRIPNSAIAELFDQGIDRLLNQKISRTNGAAGVVDEPISRLPMNSGAVVISAIDNHGKPINLNLSGPLEITIRVPR